MHTRLEPFFQKAFIKSFYSSFCTLANARLFIFKWPSERKQQSLLLTDTKPSTVAITFSHFNVRLRAAEEKRIPEDRRVSVFLALCSAHFERYCFSIILFETEWKFVVAREKVMAAM